MTIINKPNKPAPTWKQLNVKIPMGVYMLLQDVAGKRGITLSELARYILVRESGK